MFYENGVTPEEVERIQALDQLESVAYQMNTTPGYGYISRNQSHLWEQKNIIRIYNFDNYNILVKEQALTSKSLIFKLYR